MTPPSLETAREILADAAAKARAGGDAFAEIAAAAIDVVLAELDRRGQAIALFGRESPLADDPLPFEMVGGTPVAVPAPGAPRVMCGMPIDGEACCLRYGHDGDHEPHRNPDGGRGGQNPTAPPIDINTVRVIARGMGYGRMMQLAEELWREAAGDGSELTVGPCAGLLVPCVCARGARGERCGWCEGTQRVTQRVRNAIEAMNVDEAGGTMSAGVSSGAIVRR